ncbi:MAG: lipoyl(octanoyl) transferase LipB [Saprospirales bacterium]|nr:MAG: lipoyl(octanoyl) transferase LipB [Saprospirales bacterium]
MAPLVKFEDWGAVDYREAWDKQTVLSDDLIKAKRAGISLSAEIEGPKHHLIFCHHPHVYTLGKSGKQDHLLLDQKEMGQKGVSFYKINRGGDITYHGPGQLVGYPIFDLEYFFKDVRKYIHSIETSIILMLAEFGIEAGRQEGYTGVWLPACESRKNRKICAIGVHLSRWVSMHGFALNVNTDLNFFNHIVPCGIQEPDKEVTSMNQELGGEVDMDSVKQILKEKFSAEFGFDYFPDR